MNERYGLNLAFLKNSHLTIYKETIYAERNVYTHPNLSLNRLRVVFEAWVKEILFDLGIKPNNKSSYRDRLRLLQGKIPDALWKKIDELRPICNTASHELMNAYEENESAITEALNALKVSQDLAIWYVKKIKKEEVSHTEFIPPPKANFEETLSNAHAGDAGAIYDVAIWHRNQAPKVQKESEFHSKMFKIFINESFEGGYPPAKITKAISLIHSIEEKNDIHEGIYILEELIREGEVIDVYCLKAIALERLNRSISADVVALQGAEKGDPYAMNLVAQWAGHDRPKIKLTEPERMRLYEKSLGIAFNEEAAYYLSMYYEDLGLVDEATTLLEKCIKHKEDTRGLFESRLAKMLLSSGKNKNKAYELYEAYSNKGYWSSLNSADELIELNETHLALRYFKQSITTAMDSEILQYKDKYMSVRDRLLNCSELNEDDLCFITECLGDA